MKFGKYKNMLNLMLRINANLTNHKKILSTLTILKVSNPSVDIFT